MKTLKEPILITALCIIPLTVTTSLYAQERQSSGYLAAGMFMSPEYEGSDDYEVNPLIAARVDYGDYYLETSGLGIRADFSRYDFIDFGLVINYRMERDDDVENEFVRLLDEVDSAFEIGLFTKVRRNGIFDPSDEVTFDIEILTDASSTHEGTLITFGPSYSVSVTDRLRLGASLKATYVSDEYNDTYFSVDNDNAIRSGLREFEAEGGIKDLGLTITANYRLTDRWGLLGIAGYKSLLGDAADSPIVEDVGDDAQIVAGIGVSYGF